MTLYAAAPEVAKIVERLVDEIPDHQPLADVRIESIWRDKAKKSKGRTIFATVSLISGRSAFLVNQALWLKATNDPFFVLEAAIDTWEELTDDERVALIDHNLCHLQVEDDEDGRPVLGLRGPDVEEFASVIERRGIWRPNVARLANVIADQLRFDLDDPSGLENGDPA